MLKYSYIILSTRDYLRRLEMEPIIILPTGSHNTKRARQLGREAGLSRKEIAMGKTVKLEDTKAGRAEERQRRERSSNSYE